MPNTEVIHVIIDTQLKNDVEDILQQLNMSPSDAIKLFYRQIELNGGLPFEIKIPPKIREEQRNAASPRAGV